jgi:hypothetical protein
LIPAIDQPEEEHGNIFDGKALVVEQAKAERECEVMNNVMSRRWTHTKNEKRSSQALGQNSTNSLSWPWY